MLHITRNEISVSYLEGLGSSHGRHNVAPLDATIVDVYTGAQSVIFVVNPFSASSLNYVRYVARMIMLPRCYCVDCTFYISYFI